MAVCQAEVMAGSCHTRRSFSGWHGVYFLLLCKPCTDCEDMYMSEREHERNARVTDRTEETASLSGEEVSHSGSHASR